MKAFFDHVRANFGPLSQAQVDGFNVLLSSSETLPFQHRAYVLATAWHETAFTMQPIMERGGPKYLSKYEPGTKLGKALGNTLPGDGVRFAGRGYVQLTGRRNYAKASSQVGVDLLAHPDQAMDPPIAAKIIVMGMSEGWFTSRKLSDFSNYVEMRKIVNGTDKAKKIAGYASRFEAAFVV